MEWRSMLLLLVLVLIPVSSYGATRLGLFHTQQEVAIWATRATSGPYRVAGDVSTNSPGDWNRIVANRNTFAANPTQGRWLTPFLTGGCVDDNENTYGWPEAASEGGSGFPWSSRLRDTAFYNMVLGITTDHAILKTELLWVSSQSFTQWGNPSGIWCFDMMVDGAPAAGVTSVLSRVLFAYDYMGRAAFTQGELDQLDRWFFDAADFWRRNIDVGLDGVFSNRQAGNYTRIEACSDPINAYVGSANIQSYAKFYNDRRGTMYAFTGLASVYLTHVGRTYTNGRYGTLAQALQSAKMFAQEFIRFSVFPEGYVGDFENRTLSLTDLGWGYAGHSIANVAVLADAFARAGDPSLYTYNTALGDCNTAGTINDGGSRVGQNRDLHFAIESYNKYITDVYARYCDTDYGIPCTAAAAGNAARRIDGRDPRDGSAWAGAHETYSIMSNLYFQNTFIKEAYTRTHVNSIGYLSNISGGPRPWEGPAAIFPGTLFMFGNLEGSVGLGQAIDPYDLTVTANLVGHWPLDETSGIDAADASGNGHTGTLTGGPTWTMGRINGSLRVDGVNQYVDMGDVLDLSGAFSYAAWVQAESFASPTPTIIAKYNGSVGIQVWLGLNGTNVELNIYDSTLGGYLTRRSSITSLGVKRFYHVVATYDGTTSHTGIRLYLDGVQVDNTGSNTGTFVQMRDISDPLQIGSSKNNNTQTFFWHGLIDDVRIYTRQLSATEVMELYKAGAYASLVHWPDRRPIALWFVAEETLTSATNPRGYLRDPDLDVSNQSNFNTLMLNLTDSIIVRLNAMNPRPQGVLVWDLEGQEFAHAFTYVGNPPQLSVMAPEMDAVADQIFAKFLQAGYQVGMTLRPSTFGTGTQRPATCNTGTAQASQDVFVDTDAVYPNRGYVCTGTPMWTQPGGSQPVYQTVNNDDGFIYNELHTKVTYARNRWGAKMFYVDSTVYINGHSVNPTIIRQLQLAFPDTLFFPENETIDYWSASAPYNQALDTSQAVRDIYPLAFSMLMTIDGVDYTDQTIWNTLVNTVKHGNILVVHAWWDNPVNAQILQIYRDATATSAVRPALSGHWVR